jgi:hypothetical protein
VSNSVNTTQKYNARIAFKTAKMLFAILFTFWRFAEIVTLVSSQALMSGTFQVARVHAVQCTPRILILTSPAASAS